MFLLQFRANFSYSRYWEAMASVYTMHGKLLDFSSKLAAFHLQADCYKEERPPSYGNYQDYKKVHHHRQPSQPISLEDLKLQLEVMDFTNDFLSSKLMDMIHPIKDKSNGDNSEDIRSITPSTKPVIGHRRKRSNFQELQDINHHRQPSQPVTLDDLKIQLNEMDISNETLSGKIMDKIHPIKDNSSTLDVDSTTQKVPKHRRNRSLLGILTSHDDVTSKMEKGVIPKNEELRDADEKITECRKKPSLFLQEAVHLISLLSAVASTTLRNDFEYAEATLITFTPGQSLPHADPDAFSSDVRRDWDISQHKSLTIIHYLFGLSRSRKYRDIYNAARPFRVIGGVSDNEITMIQKARGPFAKVSLIHMWILEFLSRETMAGSTGVVHPNLIGTLFGLLSDFMAAYNHARMISKNPFPFVHAQLTSFFVLMVVGLLPILMLNYVPNFALGLFLNLITVMCFTGLHEVARELELPFKNAPNDIPLNNYQGQLNEALLTTFLGYHPDSYFDVSTTEKPMNDKGLTLNFRPGQY